MLQFERGRRASASPMTGKIPLPEDEQRKRVKREAATFLSTSLCRVNPCKRRLRYRVLREIRKGMPATPTA